MCFLLVYRVLRTGSGRSVSMRMSVDNTEDLHG